MRHCALAMFLGVRERAILDNPEAGHFLVPSDGPREQYKVSKSEENSLVWKFQGTSMGYNIYRLT